MRSGDGADLDRGELRVVAQRLARRVKRMEAAPRRAPAERAPQARRYGARLHHDIDDPVRHDDDLARAACPRARAAPPGSASAASLGRVFAGVARQLDRAAQLAVDLYGERHRLLDARVPHRPRGQPRRPAAARGRAPATAPRRDAASSGPISRTAVSIASRSTRPPAPRRRRSAAASSALVSSRIRATALVEAELVEIVGDGGDGRDGPRGAARSSCRRQIARHGVPGRRQRRPAARWRAATAG